MSVLTDDPRPIAFVGERVEFGEGWRVGRKGVTKIEAYDENGDGAPVPWIAVYVGDEIRWRLDARLLTIEYEGAFDD